MAAPPLGLLALSTMPAGGKEQFRKHLGFLSRKVREGRSPASGTLHFKINPIAVFKPGHAPV